MGRYMLLWLLGVPIPVLLLIYAFGGLHGLPGVGKAHSRVPTFKSTTR